MSRLFRPVLRYRITDPMQRVLAWRTKSLPARAGQAALVAALAWFATGSATIWIWLGATITMTLADTFVSKRLLSAAHRATAAKACLSHMLSLMVFLSVVGILLSNPSPARVAEIGLLMCAICLNNAMMSGGSVLATGVLVGPPAAILIACPFLARMAGISIAFGDSLMLSICGGVYVVFIVRLAGNIDAEGAALRKALDDAEVAARAKSNFLAVIGHEIRTPLNGVLGMAQAMAFGALSQAQRERLDVIRDSGVALLSLIDDVLDFSRMESGDLRIAAVEFDLRAVLIGIHAASVSEAERKGLDFQLAIDPAVSDQYVGDGGRVRQVACHLVENALKFTPTGAVRLQLDVHPGGVEISVHDTGVGMSAQVVAGLFESFRPGDSAMNRSHGGSGLGLAMCHRLCAAMDGDIAVASTPGHGSVFTVRLPLPTAGQHRRVQPAERNGPLRILAAEDNPVNQQVLATLLAHLGLDPVIVADGAQALAAWREQAWDLVLMDIQMPVMDGLAATCAIRQEEEATGRTRTPILALTANAMSDQVNAYRAAGIDAVVAKPISVCDLFGAIAAATDAPSVQAASPSTSPILRASSARR